MPSVMDMFRNVIGTNQAPAPQVTQPAPKDPASVTANPLVPSSATPQSDGSVKAIPAAGEGEASPLENYSTFWQAPDPKTVKTAASLVPEFKFDPKAVREEAGKLNFAESIDPALMTKAMGGDQTAMLQVINESAQNAFAAAMGTSAKLVQAAMVKQNEAFRTSVMPTILKNHNINTELRSEIPLFENPAVAPLLRSVEQQLIRTYPDASPAEIASKAKDYVTDMSTELLTQMGRVVTEKVEPVAGRSRGKKTDWESYFNGPVSS